jgi:hypothetical protein
MGVCTDRKTRKQLACWTLALSTRISTQRLILLPLPTMRL